MVSVRRVAGDQWEEWRALRLAALAEAPEAFASTLADWSGRNDREDHWRARLEQVPLNLVVDVDHVPAGMVSAAAPANGTVEMLSLWVAPARRGSGVADALVDAVVRWARPRADHVLAVVRVANRPAIALYERHGFHDVGWATEPTARNPERRMVLPLR